MGTYTTNYNLFMPSIGEQGWGELVNGNFSTIDSTMIGLDTRVGTLETERAIYVDVSSDANSSIGSYVATPDVSPSSKTVNASKKGVYEGPSMTISSVQCTMKKGFIATDRPKVKVGFTLYTSSSDALSLVSNLYTYLNGVQIDSYVPGHDMSSNRTITTYANPNDVITTKLQTSEDFGNYTITMKLTLSIATGSLYIA